MSTGIGFGIGMPHASTDLIYEVVGSLGRSRKGVNFEALDNQPVNLVMLFLVPQGQFQKHLHTLANIAELLHKAEFRAALNNLPMPTPCCASSVIKENVNPHAGRLFLAGPGFRPSRRLRPFRLCPRFINSLKTASRRR